jgi:hypothetical protein
LDISPLLFFGSNSQLHGHLTQWLKQRRKRATHENKQNFQSGLKRLWRTRVKLLAALARWVLLLPLSPANMEL